MFPTSYSTVFMISLKECYENSHEDHLSIELNFTLFEVTVIWEIYFQ